MGDAAYLPGAVVQALPKCEASMLTPADARGRNKSLGTRCHCKAKVVIVGKKLCIRHAQAVAIEMMLRGDLSVTSPSGGR